MDISEEVRLVIAKALKLPVEQLHDETRLQDIGAESIDTIEIMFELEEKFDIDLTVKVGKPGQPGAVGQSQGQLNLEDFATVGDVCRAVSAIVAAKKTR
jgi:acyl carrier protein